MPRWPLVAGSVVVLVLVASQFLLPGIAEREVESRLIEGGGSAEVELAAVPALRLLFTDGERFEVEANGLDLDLDEELEVFDRLDGFGTVAISIDDSRAGPFQLESFALTREGSAPYTMVSTGSASAPELARFGAESLGLPGSGLAGAAAQFLFGGGEASEIPIDLDLQLASEDGGTEVVGGDARVAGLPAGPLAEIIASAVVARL